MAARLDDEARDEMALPSYLHPNPALRWMAWHRVDVVASLLRRALPRGGRVMDFGCGSGVLFQEAAERASVVFGVDPVLDAAQVWAERCRLDNVRLLHPAEVRDWIDPASLDVIVAAEVLEHVEDLDTTLGLFADLLRPDGVLIASLPTENRVYRLGRRLAGFSGHYHHTNAVSVDRRIRERSFVRRRLERLPLPGPLAVYWVASYRLATG
jgi:SAM-dependent methyltransferase